MTNMSMNLEQLEVSILFLKSLYSVRLLQAPLLRHSGIPSHANMELSSAQLFPVSAMSHTEGRLLDTTGSFFSPEVAVHARSQTVETKSVQGSDHTWHRMGSGGQRRIIAEEGAKSTREGSKTRDTKKASKGCQESPKDAKGAPERPKRIAVYRFSGAKLGVFSSLALDEHMSWSFLFHQILTPVRPSAGRNSTHHRFPSESTSEPKTGQLGKAPWMDSAIVTQALKDYKTMLWQKASQHCLGQGLEEGEPSFRPLQQVIKTLMKQDKQCYIPFAKQIVCEGVVTGERFSNNDLNLIPKCDICGQLDTKRHRYYKCRGSKPGFNGDDFEKYWLKKSNYLVYKVATNDKPHCIWYRGIMPHSKGLGMLEPHNDLKSDVLVAGDLTG